MKNVCMQSEDTGKAGLQGGSVWYVMTSPDPKAVEELLLEANLRRKEAGAVPFQYFIPYRFLRRRIAGGLPEEEREEGDYFNPQGREEVASYNELRAALKRYIFIRAQAREIERLLRDGADRCAFRSLWYYRDRNRRRVTVGHRVMERFIDACCDERTRFEVWPALDSIERNDEVVLNTTQFKGYRARVLEVVRDGKECRITVGFHLFHGAMLLKLPDLRPGDLLYERKDAPGRLREANRYKIAEDMQRKLFAVMERRLKGGLSDKERRKESAALDMLYTYRYRTWESDAMRRKFTALLLLCAALRGDASGTAEWAEKARRELDVLGLLPAGKAPADLCAYLRAALCVATGEAGCREQAMAYFRSLPKPSATHRQWMRFLTAFR